MGFLSGILDAASHAVGPTLNLMAGRAQGQAIAQQRQQQQLLQAYALQRQQQQDALARTLAQSTMQSRVDMAKHYANQDTAANARNATAAQREAYLESQPKAPVPGTQGYYDMKKKEAQIGAQYGYHPPVQGSFTAFQGTDAQGNPVVRPFNTRTGQFGEPADVLPKAASGMGGSGFSQNLQARLLGAVSEGRLADQRMSQFEQQHLQNGKLNIGTGKAVAGQLATGLVGTHSPLDIALGTAAEGTLNQIDPDYQQYLRDARLIARAEQLMSARGGSESMSNDNAFLARGGANAPESTVRAAEKSRKALFGKVGAVMQTLTPEQAAKLEKGLEALQNDDPNFDYAKTGQEIFGSAPVSGGRSNDPGGNINLGEPPKAPTAFDSDAFYRQYKGKKP